MTTPLNFAFLRSEPAPPNGRSVAILGAGPSGLFAAGYLACLGYQVDVYDKLPRAGGLMVFGIPSFRLPAERIEAGVRRLERQFGVNFNLRTKVCCSAPLHEEAGDHFSADMRSLGELVDKHDAVMVCTGSWRSRRMNIPGENLPGVLSGLEFLFPIRAARFGAPGVKIPDVAGKSIAVVGAGHSAIDVVQSALKLGASKVTLLYRRTVREAPCGAFEIDKARSLGAEWRQLATPVRVLGAQRAEGLEILQCRLGDPDEHGRRCPVPEKGTTEVIPCDMVVAAIGEVPTPPFPKELGLEDVKKGDVRWLHMTRIPNVFVAGDALTGPSKIGKAVYSGLRAARALANWLDLKAGGREAEFNAGLMHGNSQTDNGGRQQ
ncbi:glutamate synthase (NADPH) small subunit [Desulfocurvibacter africanus PCS]|uniref:Glutamate synthase (NADPH) small subunit n=1 Tax=Desulfocurvibacter africanus PCS TaxID=1262666 RepID=M5Q0J1_DESAF|nr:FAD-dependent oxidoreductase [Desulfocurvibacter africanus]EMG35723.1 glutamate synthase (NADPH) small subunit [Desulfocurvibacter africanus PCS]